ncbi:alpha/beta fold hydrolase [Jannaschia seohaensis]|uniref:Lysophospholipase n=1 Tax=Jannaschia seohaensis TaxID=475081 RepID=A0A2Y9AG34_9RHOB|nr:alpha/beta hydrolase [Jannaschia seohaensis]PWJ21109.1 lysophospholipase [Jannaschia seohaensis]SSA41519.1 lysophospholipase [Jannaschia seohaensis]
MRAGIWPEGHAGTVFVFPGRTEWVEKYADAAAHLSRHGLASIALDWRGQGLTERPKHNRLIGHVRDFRDYQRDLRAAMSHADAIGLPRPWHLLAHSMGGLIGLRALMDGTPFQRAVFSAPMWGLPLAPHVRLTAWTVSSLSSALGLGEMNTPRAGKASDPGNTPFEGNLLTRDAEMFAWMQSHLRAEPDLALGGPSLGWLNAALREMHGLARRATPQVPCLTLLGTDEAIVDPDAIHIRLATWQEAHLEIVEGGRHEVLMEDTGLRTRLYDLIGAHLAG